MLLPVPGRHFPVAFSAAADHNISADFADVFLGLPRGLEAQEFDLHHKVRPGHLNRAAPC